jgi:hypothetical protein
LAVAALVVVATVAAVLAANLGWVEDSETQRNFAKWGMAAVLAELVALFVFMARKVFASDSQVSIEISPAPNFPMLDPSRLFWTEGKCVLRTDKVTFPVRLVRSVIGQTWKVHIPRNVADKIADTDLYEFRFVDQHGNEWAAGPILKDVYVIPLQSLDANKIQTSHAGALQ